MLTPRALRPARLCWLLAAAAATAGAAGCDEIKIERRPRKEKEATAASAPQRERRLDNIRPLTADGDNRQASLSPDGRRLVWLRRDAPGEPFQVHSMNLDGTDRRRLSPADLRCEGPRFSPDGRAIIFAGAALPPAAQGAASAPDTLPAGAGPIDPPEPPEPPESSLPPETPGRPAGIEPRSWLLDPGYDLYRLGLGETLPVRLIDAPGYDAEASYSWHGARVIFTSRRDGAWSLRRLESGGETPLLSWHDYLGGARLCPESTRLVFHAVPAGGDGLEIHIADADGRGAVALTADGAVAFGPCWHPEGDLILFSSNRAGWDFELYAIRPDGTELERITHSPGFDAFPEFSRDGRQLVWTSHRGGPAAGPAQIMRAAWLR